MNTNLTVPWTTHPQMVAALFKVLPDAQDLLHAAVGLSGEVAEVMAAGSRSNVIEECGDIEFYLEAAWQAARRVWPILSDGYSSRGTDLGSSVLGYNMPDLVISSGNLLDLAKKRWVYNKIIDMGEVTAALASFELDLDDFYNTQGIDRGQVLAQNMAKLAVRYGGGSYSDAAAQARADKAGE